MSESPRSAASVEKLLSELLADDPELRDIVEEFVGSLDVRANELREAWAKTDWDLLTMLSHRLKGAGGSYGYPQLSTLGATMEQHFKAHNAAAADVQAWLDSLVNMTNAAKAGLA